MKEVQDMVTSLLASSYSSREGDRYLCAPKKDLFSFVILPNESCGYGFLCPVFLSLLTPPESSQRSKVYIHDGWQI